MATKHKYHTWYRFPSIQIARKNTFFCKDPSCYKKAALYQIHGKIARCAVCDSTFIVDVKTVTDEMKSINCPACLGVEANPETKYLEIVKEQAANFLNTNFTQLQNELSAREEALVRKEGIMEKRENRLAVQREKFLRILVQHRDKFKFQRDQLIKLRNNIEEREKNLKLLEQTNQLDQEVIADSILTIFKKMEQNNERDGSVEG